MPKSRQSTEELAKYSELLALQDAPWVPPTSLQAALRKIQDAPVVWLNQAVDMMAFGDERPSSDSMEFAARRCQASRELCQAARKDLVGAIGSADRPGDASDPIPRAYFDTPRQLGSADNSIETALDKVSTEDFMVARKGGHKKWFNVRIETRSFLNWLRRFIPGRELDLPVESYMIESMTRAEGAGYVPLCSALLWIMTDGGSTKRSLKDTEAWEAAVGRLLPLISTGEIEVIGRPVSGPSEVIKSSVFAGILVSSLLHDSIGTLTGDDPWISPTPYVDEEYWRNGFNDQVFLHKATHAAWTHLQVKKGDVLRELILPKRLPATGDKTDGVSNDTLNGGALSKTPLKADVEEAYRRRVEEFKGKTPPSREDDEQYFKSAFGLPRVRARELREKLAPREWLARGRRKSKRPV